MTVFFMFWSMTCLLFRLPMNVVGLVKNETEGDIHSLKTACLKWTVCQARSPEERGKLVDKAGTEGILLLGMNATHALELNA